MRGRDVLTLDQTICFDDKDIDTTILYLQKIKANGAIANPLDRQSYLNGVFGFCLQDARNNLDMLTTASQAIRKTLNSLEEVVKLQEEILHVQAREIANINRLPDDVLSMIFQIICEDDTFPNAFNLSHVSLRFRSLALAMPHLWSHISLTQHPNILKFCIKRSKQVGLHVNLSSTQSPRATTLFEVVVAHCDRWVTLDMSVLFDTRLLQAMSSISVLDLPSLREITLPRKLFSNREELEQDEEENYLCYKHWRFVNINKVTAVFRHRFFSGKEEFRNLIRCELILDFKASMHNLGGFLQDAVFLQELTLILIPRIAHFTATIMDDVYKLRHLKSLSIRVQKYLDADMVDYPYMNAFMSSLEVPLLKEMNIEFPDIYREGTSLSERLDSLLPGSEGHKAKITSLHLTVRRFTHCIPQFAAIFHTFKHLEELYVKEIVTAWPLGKTIQLETFAGCASLKRLGVESMSRYRRKDLDLLLRLVQANNTSGLEKISYVELEGCQKDDLKEWFPKAEIVWKRT